MTESKNVIFSYSTQEFLLRFVSLTKQFSENFGFVLFFNVCYCYKFFNGFSR